MDKKEGRNKDLEMSKERYAEKYAEKLKEMFPEYNQNKCSTCGKIGGCKHLDGALEKALVSDSSVNNEYEVEIVFFYRHKETPDKIIKTFHAQDISELKCKLFDFMRLEYKHNSGLTFVNDINITRRGDRTG